MTDYMNCHFKGLWSITLSGTPGLLRRLFICRPGEMSAALINPGSDFLHHAHSYSLRSTSVVGTSTNRIFEPNRDGDLFHDYIFESGISGTGISGVATGFQTRLKETRTDICLPGISYQMTGNEVHRVEFIPDPATGWFVNLIEELGPEPRKEVAWSRSLIWVPDQGLYQEADTVSVVKLLADLYVSHSAEMSIVPGM
jgi:hypothetical protein